MNIIKINGRRRWYRQVQSVVRTSTAGQYLVYTDHRQYTVTGGKRAGGTRRDWFLDGAGIKTIDCTSLVDALALIDSGI